MLTLKGDSMGETAGFPGTTFALPWDFCQMSLGVSTHTSWTEWLGQVSNELEYKQQWLEY